MKQDHQYSGRFILNVVWKAGLLFLLINILLGVVSIAPLLGKVSLYNSIFPGRWRFSWSENPTAAYSVSTNNLDALFRSHDVAENPDHSKEFRVFFFGDSSVWGFLLPKEKTVPGFINEQNLSTMGGEQVRAYNLGYPTISLTKDLLLMERAMDYQPDMIVWFVTLEAFPIEKQIFTPLVQENPADVQQLIETYQLSLEPQSEGFASGTWIDRTVFGQRRELADLLRLQLYGVPWAATGLDQDIPGSYTPLQVDFEEDDTYYNFMPPTLEINEMSWNVLRAGITLAGDVPVLIVNEPIYISSGKNSDLRYNFYYPRWAYDDYRTAIQSLADVNGWNYLDLWDVIAPGDFTNTAIHVNENGSEMIANLVAPRILAAADDD